MAFENYQDMRAGDVIECFRVEEVAAHIVKTAEPAPAPAWESSITARACRHLRPWRCCSTTCVRACRPHHRRGAALCRPPARHRLTYALFVPRTARTPSSPRSIATASTSASCWRLGSTSNSLPDLRFRLDTALDYAAHVDELLDRPEVRRDLERHDPDPDRE